MRSFLAQNSKKAWSRTRKPKPKRRRLLELHPICPTAIPIKGYPFKVALPSEVLEVEGEAQPFSQEASITVEEPTKTEEVRPIFPEILRSEKFYRVHPIVKKIYRNVLPQVPLAGRLKYFQENWKILTNDSVILALQGYKIPVVEYQGTTLITESSESIKNELRGTTNNRPGNFQHARKRGYIKSDSLQISIPKYAIYSKEKRRGQSPCNKSETSELLHSLSTLQDGRT